MNAKKDIQPQKNPGDHPFRTAVLRGLAVVLPPLLTIVIFLWVGGTVQDYVLEPVTTWTRNRLVWVLEDIRQPNEFTVSEPEGEIIPLIDGVSYKALADGSFVPAQAYLYLEEELLKTGDKFPQNAEEFYPRYVEQKYLNPHLVIPFFLALFILLLYLLGKFIAAGIGRMFWTSFERGVLQVPLVRNVYSSVKQVSDFLLTERDMEYSRVVAVEWPRRGLWSLGLVTGESMADIEAAANEPVISVLVCTSPMPMTGFTVTVRKSEVVDLDITIDQAFQFVVSCGVVVPPQQLREMRAPAKAPPPLVEGEEKTPETASDSSSAGQ